MSEESVMGSKVKDLYKTCCKSEWNPTVAGAIVAFLSLLIMAWWRPWGAVGAIRNWGDWIIYGLNTVIGSESGILGYYDEAPAALLGSTGSVIGIGFVVGAIIGLIVGKIKSKK